MEKVTACIYCASEHLRRTKTPWRCAPCRSFWHGVTKNWSCAVGQSPNAIKKSPARGRAFSLSDQHI